MLAKGALSVEVQVPEKEGEGKPRRHILTADSGFITSFSDQVKTLYDGFKNSVSQYGTWRDALLHHSIGDKPYLGTRHVTDGIAGDYIWLTYNEVAKRVQNLASGLETLEIGAKSNVGLYSVNRLEWTLGEYACYHLKYHLFRL